MAITIHIYYKGKNDNAIQFAKEMISKGIVDTIRNERGNLRYEYFLPIDNTETVLLIDSWEDQNALDLHHKSAVMTQIVALREKYDLHMEVERYLSDKAELPNLDASFIRK